LLIERSWRAGRGGQAVNDTDQENKKRNREIAENESARQTVSAIRVSGWAIAAAVVIGLAAIGWVLLHNN
jgi:F0F1-type ATP synthase assembly protein I